MPVTYYSSNGAVSFRPVALHEQAVGPIEVAFGASPPDEIIEPRLGSGHRRSGHTEYALVIAALTAIAMVILAGQIS